MRKTRLGVLPELVAVVIIVAIAAFFRFHLLDTIPFGLYFDEAGQGLDALDLLSGHPHLFSPRSNGHEPLYGYLVAAFVLALGRVPLAVRLPAAVSGVSAVVMIYLLGRTMFQTEGERLSHRIAVMATLFLTISYWAVTISRVGFPSSLIPTFALTAFYFFWRGWNKLLANRSDGSFFGLQFPAFRDFCVSGAFLGLSLYVYIPCRLLPMVLIFFVFCSVLTRPRRADRQTHVEVQGSVSGRSALRALVLLTLCTVLVSAPLNYHFVAHPDDFMRKANTVSVFNPDVTEGDILRTLLNVTLRTLGMFFVQGDPNLRHNPGQRPIFDPFAAVFFVLGLGVSLANWRKPPYLFAILWFSIMLLPTVLSVGTVPHWFRAAGSLPVAHILIAIGVSMAWKWLDGGSAPRRWTGSISIIFLVMVCLSALVSYRDYFSPWMNDSKQDLRDAFDVVFAQTGATMNALDSSLSVYVLTVTPLAQPDSKHYTLEFMYQGSAPHHYVCLDESDVARELTEISQGREEMLVIEWSESALGGAHLYYSDPKELLPFLLNKYGSLVEKREFDRFDIAIYELPPAPSFLFAESLEPIPISFGGEIDLMRMGYGGSSLHETSTPSDVNRNVLPSGKSAWLVMQWQASRPMGKDYKVAVYLLDGQGRLVGQVDKLLLSKSLRPTSDWTVDQIEMDYYNLPSMPATPPGEYTIWVAVYDAETMERLAVHDERAGTTASSRRVGSLHVIKPLAPPQVEPMDRLAPSERKIAPDIQLLGHDLPERVVGPGEIVRLALYWQALDDVRHDYLVSLRFKDAEGEVRIEQRSRPVDNTYPTTEWTKDEVLRDWHDLALPADMPEGLYSLSVSVLEGEDLLNEVALGQIEVLGRARQFTIPEIPHPMEARLGQTVQFLGYDLNSDQVTAGETLKLTLYWQALEHMKTSYTVFTHLLDGKNQIRGQMDSVPRRGEAPTTSWVEGEIITDRYEIAVDPEAPTGEYVIEVGMYSPQTGERLPVYDADHNLAGNKILLQEIDVRARS
jgi:4-amino-4-deoxy-L-arabinose transferase-like glycosyltransferase